MATTLGDFQTMFRNRYGSPGDTTRLTAAVILELVKEGLREVARLTDYKGEGSGTKDSVVGQRYYDLPSAVLKIRSLYWNGDYVTPITLEELDRRSGDWRSDENASEPQFWCQNGISQFGIYPEPDSATVAVMTAYGSAAPTEPAVSGDTLDIPDRYVPVLLAYALWQQYESDTDRDPTGRFADRWERTFFRRVAWMQLDNEGELPEMRRVLDTDRDWEVEV